ncbi:sensor histidine kinase [Skermanella pratensis]|uniref:sensor histidine kinase n=1 Tax=Skermanella pratensis TaxID=2233999 RepID=UPI001787DF9C|nr:MASE4 domain-containing protein [Skermanella pratensis]
MLAAAISVLSLSVLPSASRPLPELPQINGVYSTVSTVTDLTIAFLFFRGFVHIRSWSLLILTMTFIVTGILAAVYLLSFPGGLVPGTLVVGTTQTSGWIWLFRHLVYPLLILVAMAAEFTFPTGRHEVRPVGPVIAAGLAGAVVIATGLVLLATVTIEALPAVIAADGRQWLWPVGVLGWSAASLILVALVSVWVVSRGRHVLYLWLAASLVAAFFEVVPALLGMYRFSLGWYLSRLNGVVSSGCLLVMFLTEIDRLQSRLRESLRDLGETNRTLEQRVIERTRDLEGLNQQLRKAVSAKDLLLREVYHRVKNNLQVVDTLLALQIRQTPAIAGDLSDLRHRVHALGLIHQKLMESQDLETINLEDFLRDLCQTLAASYGVEHHYVILKVTIKPDGVSIGIDFAISLGLLVTELVSNAYKHAFPSGRAGIVEVRLTLVGDGEARLVVADNGVGMPATRGPVTIGRQIIAELVDQLDGQIAIHQDHGTQVTVTFPCPPGLPC